MACCPVCGMFNGLTPRQLVMWERPAASGVVCGGVVAFVLLIGVFDYTLVTLLCRIAQLAILAGIVMKYLGKLPEKSCNPSECITQMGTSIEPIISSSLSFAFKVLTWENTLVSGKVLLASIVVAMLGNWFSDITLLFLVTVGVFTVPMGYLRNKDLVDSKLAEVNKMLGGALGKVPGASASRRPIERIEGTQKKEV